MLDTLYSLDFPGGSDGKASVYNVGDLVSILWRRKWQSTPVLLPGKSHGQRSLVGYSPWGHKESDTTERLHFPFLSFVFIISNLHQNPDVDSIVYFAETLEKKNNA